MCSCENPILNAFIFSGFVPWLKQFRRDSKDLVVHPPSEGRKRLLRTSELLPLGAGVLGEVLPPPAGVALASHGTRACSLSETLA